MNEDKSSRYQRLRRRAAAGSLALTAAVLAALLVSGASPALAAALRRAIPSAPAATAVFVLLLAAALDAAGFPLACYRTFVLDRRYGLSSEPFSRWLRDHLKGSLLGALLAVAGAEVVYLLLERTPGWWWLAGAAAFAAGLAGLALAAPIVLLPVFYSVRPLARASLRDRLMALSARAGIPIIGVYEWQVGEKTRRANAALVGMGATRRILVSDTMLDAYSEEEIEVVLAHEIAHHVHRDIRAGLLLETARMAAAFGAAALALRAGWRWAGLASPADVGGLPLLLLAGGSAMLAAAPLAHALSRRSERRADRYALALTRQPAAFISAMRRLAAQNLAEENPSRAAQWLFHSHPPFQERIEAARRFDPSPAG